MSIIGMTLRAHVTVEGSENSTAKEVVIVDKVMKSGIHAKQSGVAGTHWDEYLVMDSFPNDRGVQHFYTCKPDDIIGTRPTKNETNEGN